MIRSRPILCAAGACAIVAGALQLSSSSSAPVRAVRAGPTVLVLSRAVPAGATIDIANLRRVSLPARAVPAGAIREPEAIAYHRAVVAIPAGLPLVPSLARAPGSGSADLAAGERAVGVRVDDVTGVAALIVPGEVVDILIAAGPAAPRAAELHIDGATVLAEPRRLGDGTGIAVLLRVPLAAARQLAGAQAAGREVRLLARGTG